MTGPSVPLGSPWAGRSHAELAELARELLLAGHLIDRSGMAHLIARFGREGMGEVAIDEWMAASPVYTKRMQRLLGFEGDTVEVIFKGMQLDVGAPPEFMDFRYEVHDDHHGGFHLDHCGALMDVEPMGEAYVHTMCHDIEDPTFDATAAATNPRAQMRPVHRPPREPADRLPHCEWTVTIDPEADPLPFPVQAERLLPSKAAALPLATPHPRLPTDDGWGDYAGPFDPDLVMERFASATLAAILDEVALQGHLLSRGFLLPVVDRIGGDDTVTIGAKQVTGIAGLTARRLAATLDAPAGLDGVAAVLAVHPLFLPRSYVALALDPSTDADAGVNGPLLVSLLDCPALEEDDGLTWPGILATGHDRAISAIVQEVDPHARAERIDPVAGAAATWSVTHDATREAAPSLDEVTITDFSTGAGFAFSRRT